VIDIIVCHRSFFCNIVVLVYSILWCCCCWWILSNFT